MCTVTFINTGKEVVITSNRDEQVNRPEALYPKIYETENKAVLYPKDVLGGGTWYAADEKGTVIVLLNGGKEKHISNPPYKCSRGVIVTELIASDHPVEYWKLLDLANVEPFTLVIYSNCLLYEAIWDGTYKHLKKLAIDNAYIWSSATLYDVHMRTEREKWFSSFLATEDVTKASVLNFHTYEHAANKSYGLVMNRASILQTVSITQTVITTKGMQMQYHDLLNKHIESCSFNHVNI